MVHRGARNSDLSAAFTALFAAAAPRLPNQVAIAWLRFRFRRCTCARIREAGGKEGLDFYSGAPDDVFPPDSIPLTHLRLKNWAVDRAGRELRQRTRDGRAGNG